MTPYHDHDAGEDDMGDDALSEPSDEELEAIEQEGSNREV